MIDFSLPLGFVIIMVMGYAIGKFIEGALKLHKESKEK